jgi:hypothetical protein
MWPTFEKITLDGWSSTARLVVLLLIYQSPIDVLIFISMRR